MIKLILIAFLIGLILFLIFTDCSPINISRQQEKPTELIDCFTYEDSIYVIDNWSYNQKTGNRKPPCSMSPDYCGCMENRGIIPKECK